MTEFEQACVKEVKRIRELLQDCDAISQFSFSVNACGRVRDGEAELTFGVGTYSANVTANSVDGALYEHMRRQGWERSNKPICIGRVDGKADDDLPF